MSVCGGGGKADGRHSSRSNNRRSVRVAPEGGLEKIKLTLALDP